jgi:hypothetical protein
MQSPHVEHLHKYADGDQLQLFDEGDLRVPAKANRIRKRLEGMSREVIDRLLEKGQAIETASS